MSAAYAFSARAPACCANSRPLPFRLGEPPAASWPARPILPPYRPGTLPPIRAFALNGQPVPWFAYNRYNPYNDYYMDGYGINLYVDTFPYSAFDPGYWDFNGPYGYDDGQAYNFSPDTEAYQDFASGLAAGEAAGAMLGTGGGMNNTSSMDFQGMDFPGDPANDPNFVNNPDLSNNPNDQMPLGPDQS